jgi:hypothetical protein
MVGALPACAAAYRKSSYSFGPQIFPDRKLRVS